MNVMVRGYLKGKNVIIMYLSTVLDIVLAFY